jgi:predicted helicase
LNPDADVDALVNTDQNFMKWTDRLKTAVQEGKELRFAPDRVRQGVYRPFVAKYIYFDPLLVHRRYQQHLYWPDANAKKENRLIWIKTGGEVPFFSLLVKAMPDLLPQGGSQCFPFYTYTEDGSERRENITDWALQQFQTRYGDPNISKWDIFHYVYAVLHHPQYRERYAANLRRELPRIPFVGEVGRAGPSAPPSERPKRGAVGTPRPTNDAALFHAFAAAGKKLAELHVGYEQQPEFPLRRRENPQSPLNWRVEKMRLSKDKTSLTYNDFLTLDGIPPETFEYRLGNRSALEWVIDQYQVSTDKRSGITNDPNRPDDPEYIVCLLGQVITVSLETVKVVKGLQPIVSA